MHSTSGAKVGTQIRLKILFKLLANRILHPATAPVRIENLIAKLTDQLFAGRCDDLPKLLTFARDFGDGGLSISDNFMQILHCVCLPFVFNCSWLPRPPPQAETGNRNTLQSPQETDGW